MVGYLQSTGLGQFRPLVLNGRGGNVGIGTPIPSANLDVTGTIRATSDITAPNITSLTSATAFASDTAVWTSNALAITNANVASLNNRIIEAPPSFTFDLGINLASMTSNAVLPIGDGAYPSNTPYFGQKMPIASGGWYLQQLNDTSMAFNNFTVARLNLRGTRDALFTFDPDLVTRLDVMYSSNFDPFVWQHLKNTGGSNASARFFSRGYNGGMSSAKSEWFEYPVSMVDRIDRPLWLGLQIADASTQSTGFRLRSATMDVL